MFKNAKTFMGQPLTIEPVVEQASQELRVKQHYYPKNGCEGITGNLTNYYTHAMLIGLKGSGKTSYFNKSIGCDVQLKLTTFNDQRSEGFTMYDPLDPDKGNIKVNGKDYLLTLTDFIVGSYTVLFNKEYDYHIVYVIDGTRINESIDYIKQCVPIINYGSEKSCSILITKVGTKEYKEKSSRALLNDCFRLANGLNANYVGVVNSVSKKPREGCIGTKGKLTECVFNGFCAAVTVPTIQRLIKTYGKQCLEQRLAESHEKAGLI